MTTLEHFVSPALTRALGWTLLHSLWQGALVAAVLAGALLLLRRQRAEVRYVVSAGALGAVVALAGLTFGLYFTAGAGASAGLKPSAKSTWQQVLKSTTTSAAAIAASAGATAAMPARSVGSIRTTNGPTTQAAAMPLAAPLPATRPFAQSLGHALNAGLRYFDRNLPLLVVAWLLGLLAMSLRMLGGLLYVQRLRRYRVRPLPAVWQERLAALAARGGVRGPVALLESALVRVPLVVGHLRPVILLPLGTVAGLSPAYLEAILAHELAHVLRRDYLVNLLQTVAEVLFFYHPAVWFVANCVRTERENCCDDTATALVGGDPLRLALALTALAEWSQSAVVPAAPRLALAVMGRRGALLNRVRRLVQRRPAAPTLAEGLMAGALVLGGLSLLGGSVVLAGPLARPAAVPTAKPTAFDWQTGPATPAPRAAGITDTSKLTSSSSTTTTTTTAAVAPVAPAPPAQAADREISSTQHEADDDDTTKQGRRPRWMREEHRIIINGRDMMPPPPFPGNPGTVVITKDKKGRLTDLVVNGQRVEAVTDKGKKGKGDKNQRVEIIQVAPPGDFAMRGFGLRNDGDMAQQLKRDAEREAEREIKRNHEFQFDFPDFGTQSGQNFRLDPNGRLSRTYRLNRLNGMQTPDVNVNIDGRRIELEALRGAERGLRRAATAKGLNANQRKEIGQELERVRAQLRRAESASSSQRLRLNGDDARRRKLDAEMRARDEEMRDRDEELQDRAEEMHDRQQELQERRQELQERIRESQQELQDLERDRADQGRDRADHDRDQNEALNEALVNQLQKDGLIQDKDNFQLRLTARSLTVNGKEQPASVQQKYLKQYESTGRKMSATGALAISHNGNTTFNRSETPRAPRPPRPPRAPRAPQGLMQVPPVAPVPPVPPMQALPAPPRPPRIDTESLRKELRKDGVIGADEKNLQFQLNASGLTVNGKKQPEELAAKYRKLTGHADGKTFNMMISTQD